MCYSFEGKLFFKIEVSCHHDYIMNLLLGQTQWTSLLLQDVLSFLFPKQWHWNRCIVTKQGGEERSGEIEDAGKSKKNRKRSCSTKGKTKAGGLV